MSDEADELLKNMKSTSGCRFNAAKRLEAREAALTRLIAFTSTYVVGLTILPYFLHTAQTFTDQLGLVTVFFAIIILVASLLQSSAKDGVNAEQHHRCALEIAQLRRALKLESADITRRLLKNYVDSYDRVLEKYSINHDALDYCQYQIDRPEEFPWVSKFGWARIYTNVFVSRHVANFVLLFITITLGVVVLLAVK